jgi:hypothetical protein
VVNSAEKKIEGDSESEDEGREKESEAEAEAEAEGGKGTTAIELPDVFTLESDPDVEPLIDVSYPPVPSEEDHLEVLPGLRHPWESAMKPEVAAEISSPVNALTRLMGPPKSPALNKK